jgi:hypothetical protein
MYVYHAEVLPSLANARAPFAVGRLERRTVMAAHTVCSLRRIDADT